MNVWDVATIVGVARVALGFLVLGLLVIWLERHDRGRPQRVRSDTRSRHDSR